MRLVGQSSAKVQVACTCRLTSLEQGTSGKLEGEGGCGGGVQEDGWRVSRQVVVGD